MNAKSAQRAFGFEHMLSSIQINITLQSVGLNDQAG